MRFENQVALVTGSGMPHEAGLAKVMAHTGGCDSGCQTGTNSSSDCFFCLR